jgi:hypothetical protein
MALLTQHRIELSDEASSGDEASTSREQPGNAQYADECVNLNV